MRLADTDNLGHINNISYIAYLETIRTEWYSKLKNSRTYLDGDGWDWILGEINIRFMKEVNLSDNIKVLMWVSRIGSKSWDFEYVIVNQKNEIVTRATTTQIAFDYNAKRSQTIPDMIRLDLEQRLLVLD